MLKVKSWFEYFAIWSLTVPECMKNVPVCLERSCFHLLLMSSRVTQSFNFWFAAFIAYKCFTVNQEFVLQFLNVVQGFQTGSYIAHVHSLKQDYWYVHMSFVSCNASTDEKCFNIFNLDSPLSHWFMQISQGYEQLEMGLLNLHFTVSIHQLQHFYGLCMGTSHQSSGLALAGLVAFPSWCWPRRNGILKKHDPLQSNGRTINSVFSARYFLWKCMHVVLFLDES